MVPDWYIKHLRVSVKAGSPILSAMVKRFGLEWYALYRLQLAKVQTRRVK